MELSLYLAKVFGLYLLIMAVFFAFRREQLEASIRDLFSSQGMLLVSGALALILGLMIVIAHPVWECSWRVVITILGYLGILKGIMRICYPKAAKEAAFKIMNKCSHCRLIIVLALALFLIYHGFRG